MLSLHIGGGADFTERRKEEGEGEEPPYEDIDMSQRRHSDYINVDMLDLNESDSENEADPAHSIRGSKYVPSVKLHSHPLLRKSLSNSEVDSGGGGGGGSMIELMKEAAKKPKNRAPPPPPGASKDPPPGGPNRDEGVAPSVVSASVGVAMKHKRSQSDVHSGANWAQRSPGQRSPIPEQKVSHKSVLQGQSSPSLVDQRAKHGQRVALQSAKVTQSDQPSSQASSSAVKATPTLQNQQRGIPVKPSAPPASGGVRAKPKNPIPHCPPPPSGPAPPGPPREHGKGASAQQSRLSVGSTATPAKPHPPGQNKGVGHVAKPCPPLQDKGVGHAAPHPPGAWHVYPPGHDKEAGHVAKPHPPGHAAPGRASPHPQDHDRSSPIDHEKARSANTTPTSKPKRHAPPPPAVRKTPNASPEVQRKSEPAPPTYATRQGPPIPSRLNPQSLAELELLVDTQVHGIIVVGS